VRRALDKFCVKGEILLTERVGHAYELASTAATSGADLILAWGGDGTINEVGRALVQHDEEATPDERRSALGIIPGGSGNGLARELRIPFDPEKAIGQALEGEVRTLDAGELGDRLFFNVAGIGLDSHIAALVSTRISHRGALPYLKATLRDLFRYEPVDYSIEIGGRPVQTSALFVAVANSTQYGLGAHIAPQAVLDDGLLDVVIVEDRGLVGNIARIPALFTGAVDRCQGVTVQKADRVTVRSATPMLFHVDGEAVQGTDTLVARVHPAALRVRASSLDGLRTPR
jgi:YegS/Rv2252/BmrU family lipid kinase